MNIHRVVSWVLRVLGVAAAFAGMYRGYREEYAYAAFIVSIGIFCLMLARDEDLV